ncbi:MAG TPA: hypothetical protein PKU96_01355 [bacterium]|jgi:cytochrome c biogenesis protein CcdA|nr:hypothetical protein [Myxococcales bacterium]OQA58715.1 MAG: Cytochrome C biogenesis protein transmembrane region [bacterium ADurb.Bin270]HPW45000.1 hypothetical protein [bacterium]HQG13789.1 hypothetical protein [bacterium]
MNKKSETMHHAKVNWVIAAISFLVVAAFFAIAKYIPMDALERMGMELPLPLFTFIIGLVDGFNPCNIFVLTMLLGFLVSASSSRFRLYLVGYTFVIVVGIFYFLFMAAWLNVFKYMGFIDPLRIAVAVIAIVAGIINCKELFFFKKGVSLTINDHNKGVLYRKMRKMDKIMVEGGVSVLIISSATLAIFSSLVELPCTAGFPIIYTGILTGNYVDGSVNYYLYLLYYNLIYVLPLIVVIAIAGVLLKSRNISVREVQIIKFIGGLIMLLLGIVLLVNPGLIMVQ